MIHGYPVALGAIAFVTGAVLWRYKKLHRLSAIGFGLGAFFLAVGVVPWLEALASLTASGTGITVLILVDIVSGFGAWYEAVCKHMHHRIRTPVLMVAFGTAVVLTIGSASRLLREAATSPGKSSAAVGRAISQIQSGHAAHAVPSHHALMILLLACAALVLLIVMAHRMEKGSSKSAGPAAIRGGRPAPSGRRAIPAGRRR